jgi:LysR family transcriptional regulator, nitrogen assimilation regulatory protein
MDVKQLRYFLGVLRAGSLSKAANLLHVAQPALGVQIRNLEQELGVELLQRHARGVVPTKAGELLAQRAESLLHEFSRVRNEMTNFAAMPSGRVILGTTSTVAHVVVAEFVERCRLKFPDVRLVIAKVRGSELIDKVVRKEVDIGLAFRPQDNDEIISEALIHDELVLVRSEKLPSEVDFEDIVANELILPSENHLVRRMVKRAAVFIGQEPKVFYDADSVAMIKELVKRGLGPTILPLTAIDEEVQEGKLFFARIRNVNFIRTLFLLQPASEFPSRSIELVRGELRSLIWEFADAGKVGWVRAKHPASPLTEDDEEDGRELNRAEAVAAELAGRKSAAAALGGRRRSR